MPDASSETEAETAVCVCGGDLVLDGDQWLHARIEDFSHDPTPLVHQPVPKGHPNAEFLNGLAEAELEAKRHERDHINTQRVEEYTAHVEKIESPGYVHPGPPGDTLGEWLYDRFGRSVRGYENYAWLQIPEDDRQYWRHEAEAVRRAVARGGFKDYDPALGEGDSPRKMRHDT